MNREKRIRKSTKNLLGLGCSAGCLVGMLFLGNAYLSCKFGESLASSHRCRVVWDPIDGPRVTVGDVRWGSDSKTVLFEVTIHAYWPCSYARTYGWDLDTLQLIPVMETTAKPDRASPSYRRVSYENYLKTGDWTEDERQLLSILKCVGAPNILLFSPSGKRVVAWDDYFWYLDEFRLVVADLESGKGVYLQEQDFLQDLEHAAIEACKPSQCR